MDQELARVYTGQGLVTRLFFFAEKTTDNSARKDALVSAAAEIAKSINTDQMQFIVNELVLMRVPTEQLAAYQDWINTTRSNSLDSLNRLNNELGQPHLHYCLLVAAYRSNLIKESVRMGHCDLGDFHASAGNTSEALVHYNKAKELATTPSHIIDTSVKIIHLLIHSAQYSSISAHISRAQNAPQVSIDHAQSLSSQLACFTAIHCLFNGNFVDACSHFKRVELKTAEMMHEESSFMLC